MKNNTYHLPESTLRTARLYGSIASKITRIAGRPVSLIIAFLIVLIWAASGPIFNFSDTWQLVINTGTTIITFLMVFIIQQTQNKDTAAIQLKLNELIACNKKASNRLIDVEDLTEDELMVLKKFYVKLADLAEREDDLYSSHSVDEADDYHKEKATRRKTTAAKRTDAKKTPAE
ncbi:MAG TPA: low affinity iron permease family protein [Chitinophagaceae bacterium]|nr:low affinity iron permease family protein [Chitinophagaceae bacterium]